MSTSIYRIVERNAREFEKSYPEGLAAQLEWWREALGIDRVRLLRMIGMSARQAARRKDDDLNEIVESPRWADNALGLEGMLVRVLSFYHHDWRGLSEEIREAAAARREEASRPTGPASAIKRPHARRNGKASDIWADRIHQGGRQALTSLLHYLVEAEAEGSRAGS
jgi:hypothetical protein